MAGSPMKERPLSPHLQVYKPMLTMMMSIVHRITGAGLYFGMALFVWWLFAAGHSAGYFDFVQGFIGSWFGRLVLLGFTWALVHHALGGLRHLVWDTGRGFDLKLIEVMAKGTLIGSLALTLMIWAVAYAVR
ncbi:MAG: succinate dehydrogenase, cytochrome b556 subunit [Anderseniella sp.]|nr:succinate dehydrogenase, cytochrome b556 subunit [Anderseniella sp.]